MKVLFVTPEAQPLVKTGGLADVCGSLPAALADLGCDVRLALPAYPQTVARAGELVEVARLAVPCAPAPVRLLEGRLGAVPLYLVDAPGLLDRPGHPYLDAAGHDQADNALRFATFARAAVAVALDQAGLGWAPDMVHCHDWQTGLVPALLFGEPRRPATSFTVHNLAYQGLFPAETLGALGLPEGLWTMHGMEFHGQLSFIKGGLAYADWVTTVSPTYAREIQTPELGCGLDGLLRHRRRRLVGILNGADYGVWDPTDDDCLRETFGPGELSGKAACKADLQERLGLPADPDAPLLAFCGRLVEQKGVDVLLAALPRVLRLGAQVVVVGQGERRFGAALESAAAECERLAVHVGYTEALAHRVLAGADLFLMPSQFEPCGLTQLYALRYGAVPVVRGTGGLADTVVDTDLESLLAGTATGFAFDEPTPAALARAVEHGLECRRWSAVWDKLVHTAMTREFGWARSARAYLDLYRSAPGRARLLAPRALPADRRSYGKRRASARSAGAA